MNLLTNVPVLLAAASSKPKTSGSPVFLLVIVVLGAAAYFLLIRPQQQRTRQQREQMTSIEVGDEVLTAGGIVGRVLEMDDDRFTLLTGEHNEEGVVEGTPTRIVMVRSAILRKLEPQAGHAGSADAELHDEDEDHQPDDEGHEETGR